VTPPPLVSTSETHRSGQGCAATRELVAFVCAVCGQDFAVSRAVVADPARLLLCPCCGETGLAPRTHFAERPSATPGRPA